MNTGCVGDPCPSGRKVDREMADLELRLDSVKTQYAFGEVVWLTFVATNTSLKDLFVVTGEDRIYQIDESKRFLTVILGQTKPAIEFDYFEFRPPKLRRLAPGASLSSRLSLGMPIQQSVLSANGRADFVEVDLSGDVTVSLEIGYGTERFRAKTLDPFGEYLSWQKLAASNPITIHVASRGAIQPAVA